MIEQGSPEWHALRVGKVTASRVADIMRTTKSGVSATRQRYLGELVAERLTGNPTPMPKTADMAWGNEVEADAASAYAFYTGARLEKIPFIDHPTIAMSGASPDWLVGDDGLIEIKCPATHTHIASLLGAPIDPDYITQMQWQMACTGRQWCDWVTFDPRMPEEMKIGTKRVKRDPLRIDDMESAVRRFLDDVDATVASLTARFRRQTAAE